MREETVSVVETRSELKGVRVDGSRRDRGAEGERGHEGSQT